jgi:hypothetical protein
VGFIVIGWGERDTVLCIVVGFEGAGILIGEDVAMRLGEVLVLLAAATVEEALPMRVVDDAEADTTEVCGSLGPLLNG